MSDRVLAHLEPKKVFERFEDLTRIPRVSRNTKAVSDYLVAFAKEKGLRYRQDEMNNVVIFRPAAPRFAHVKPVMLQSHMDMVGAKRTDSHHDFDKDPLTLHVEEDWIYATGTTLGADDGIGVALSLALLEEEGEFPALECVFTVDEEIGMLGASAIDLSDCHAGYLINLDSEEEGVFTVSCAGGLRSHIDLPLHGIDNNGLLYVVEATGGMGGHSGVNLLDHRGNMIRVMAEGLQMLYEKVPFTLISIRGGEQDNAFCSHCEARLMIDPDTQIEFEEAAERVSADMRKKCKELKGNPRLIVKTGWMAKGKSLNLAETEKVLKLLNEVPDGLQEMSPDIPDLPLLSLNLGICRVNTNQLAIDFAIRSSDTPKKEALAKRLRDIAQEAGGSVEESGVYSGWNYDPHSKIREMAVSVFEKMFGKTPRLEAIHAGLECGIFKEKLPELDILAMGVDMADIHSSEEHVSVSSTARTYAFLKELLQELGE